MPKNAMVAKNAQKFVLKVAAITEEHRKKIRYTCSSCKPEKGNMPCILACNQNAITCIWKPK
jgi:hypothetical protein